MKKALAVIASLFTMFAFAQPVSAAVGGSDGKDRSQSARERHEKTVAFWTNAKVRKAVPRDFVFDKASGRFSLVEPRAKGGSRGKPGGGGGDGGDGTDGGTSTTTVTGASWTGAGPVANATGMVLFAMGNSYYTCSATALNDGKSDRTVIVTAAHCVYDNDAGEKAFATNWMFVPNYDAAPATLDAQGRFCDSTEYGCWTADSLLADTGFTTPNGFVDEVLPYDFGFAVVSGGGMTGDAALEDTLPTALPDPVFSNMSSGDDAAAFGYPAAQKYKGKDLTYCAGPIGFHSLYGSYRLACNMTSGSSGGGWWSQFDSTAGSSAAGGGIASVNSYGYADSKNMYGPLFNATTAELFDQALSVVPGSNLITN